MELYNVLVAYNLIDKNITQDKFNINCFVHNDETPSMTIFLDTNKYYCHGCGAYGDYLDAICEIEKCNQFKAQIIFHKIKNGQYYVNTPKQTFIKFKPKLKFKEAINKAKFYFERADRVDWDLETYDYMFNRGYKSQVLNDIDVRFTFNDKYKIVMPVIENGSFRGYVKRRTDGEDSIRKYLYNDGFSPKIIQGDYRNNIVVITEGYMDWLKLKQNGFNNACAILRWKINKQQLTKIKRYAKIVISALDNTETGEEGTRILEQHFDNVIRFPFPFNRKDVGEMTDDEITESKIELRRILKNMKG